MRRVERDDLQVKIPRLREMARNMLFMRALKKFFGLHPGKPVEVRSPDCNRTMSRFWNTPEFAFSAPAI
jgi:hypothetical protein